MATERKSSGSRKRVQSQSKGSRKKSISLEDRPETPDTFVETVLKPPSTSDLDQVISGEVVESLKIKEEDLVKLHQTRPPREEKASVVTRAVTVRKKARKLNELVDQKSAKRNVTVLKKLPTDVSKGNVTTLGAPPAGLRFDETGTFLPHSILGEVNDFATELEKSVSETTFNRTLDKLATIPPIVQIAPSPEEMEEVSQNEKHSKTHESNALHHWKRCMDERRAQQAHLSDRLNISPDRLTMNHGDSYRTVQEQRQLIDRAIPPVDYGKGFRAGSEFYCQQVEVGRDETGIRTTLTLTEKGFPPEIENIGISQLVQKEKGLTPSLEKNVPAHFTWKESPYLSERKDYLEEVLDEIAPPQQEFSDLCVRGRSVFGEPQNASLQRRGSVDSLDYTSSEENEEEHFGHVVDSGQGPLVSEIDIDLPMIGPVLSINGDTLKWMGKPNTMKSHSKSAILKPLEYFVSFQSSPNELSKSHLHLENTGTTAIYYSWQKIPRSNELNTLFAGQKERFFFDIRGGVLLPGERKKLEFLFKSDVDGVFTEYWSFQTGPVLCAGRPIHVKLTGITFSEDKHASERNAITDKLMHEIAVTSAHKVINQIVNSICSPQRTPSPALVSFLEEDVFCDQNPGVYYSFDAVAKLRKLYMEVMIPESEPIPATESGTTDKAKEERGKKEKGLALSATRKDVPEAIEPIPEGPPPQQDVPDWDLSLDTLQELLMDIEDDLSREEKLGRMNEIVGLMSFPPSQKLATTPYSVIYKLLSRMIDQVEVYSTLQRRVLGLPVKQFTSDTPRPATPPEETAVSVQSGKKKTSKDQGKGKLAAPTGKKSSSSNIKEEKKTKKTRQNTTPSPGVKAESHQDVEYSGKDGAPAGDPVIEEKYREQFHVSVYQLLSDFAVDFETSLLDLKN